MVKKSALSQAFEDYRKDIPEDVRTAMKTHILEAEMGGYDALIETSTYILAQLVGGDISPQVAQEARAYLELIMTSISAKLLVQRAEGGSAHDLIESLQRAKKDAKRHKRLLLIDQPLDGIEIEMKQAGEHAFVVDVSEESS